MGGHGGPLERSEGAAGMVSGASIPVGTMTDVDAWVADHWGRWLSDGTAAPATSCLLKGQRQQRVTVFYFAGAARRPAVVVKVAAHATWGSPARREFEALQAVRSAASPSLADAVPMPLGLYERGAVAAVAMEAVPGNRYDLPDLTRAHTSRFAQRAVRRYLAAAATVSADLAETAATGTSQPVATLASRVSTYRAQAPLSPAADGRLAGFIQTLAATDGRYVPAWQHGDVAPGNLLLTRDGPRLIDWEAAHPEHLPWFDRAYSWLSLARLTHRRAGSWSCARALVHLFDLRGSLGADLSRGTQERWDHPIPPRWAMALTAIELALTYGEPGVEVWTPYLEALLCDEDVRDACAWLVPAEADLA